MLFKSQDCPHKLGGRAKRRGIEFRRHTTSPSLRGKPLVLLCFSPSGQRPKGCADKPVVVATDAFIPRQSPNLGGEFVLWTTPILSTKLIGRKIALAQFF